MHPHVTEASPAAEGRTVYVMPDAGGLGLTLDRALDALPDARNVVVCGDRIGGKAATQAWVDRLTDWRLVSVDPYVERHGIRLRVAGAATGGHPISVTRAEAWFGEGVEPEAARDAMRVVRGVCAEWGARPIAHPAVTGRRMLAAHWSKHGHTFPSCPPEVADLLTSTSGQGRFEVFPAAAPAGGGIYPRIYYADARFQYAACAGAELPHGTPTVVEGEPVDPYAASWCQVTFDPAEGLPVGLLPYHLDGKRWTWPREGRWSTWCSGAELHLARRWGYQLTVHRSIVWPERSRLGLRAFADLLVRHRDRIDALPIDRRTADAARTALRGILVSTIGSLHGYSDGRAFVETRTHGPDQGPTTAPPAGSGPDMFRPEWSTAIWAMARQRLARVLLDQRAPVLGCTLDGFYVGGAPVLAPDRGTVGTFRLIGSTQWPEPITSLPELYAMGATIDAEQVAA